LTLNIQVPVSEKRAVQTKIKRQMSETYAIVRSSSFVKVMIILSALWPIGGGAVNVLLSVYSFDIFHAGNQGVGILYASLGLGFILGGGLTPYLSRWILPAAAVGFVVEGIAHLLVSQSPNLTFASLFLLIATVGASVGNASTNTLVMHTIDRNLHGRMFGLFSTLRNSILGATMFLSGLLLEVMSPRFLGLIAGLLIAVIAAVFGFFLVKSKPVTQHCSSASHLL
jgi:hypothetical protein